MNYYDNCICRAKDKNGHWREGYYVRHEDRQPCVIGDGLKDDEIEHYIFYDGFADWNMPRSLEAIEVDPNTVCRYTGINDKHGKRIFTNDVIRVRDFSIERKIVRLVVEFDEGGFCAGRNFLQSWLSDGEFHGEVIGNIFDNPTALEEVDQDD